MGPTPTTTLFGPKQASDHPSGLEKYLTCPEWMQFDILSVSTVLVNVTTFPHTLSASSASDRCSLLIFANASQSTFVHFSFRKMLAKTWVLKVMAWFRIRKIDIKVKPALV